MTDSTLLIRATLALYADALRQSTHALGRHVWIIGLVPAYTLGLQFVTVVAQSLGFLGGFLVFLAVAACASSFLAVISEAIANQRLRLENLSQTFGRFFSRVVQVFFVFWIIQLLLAMIVTENPNLLWLLIAVNAGIFLVFNPVPELIYQGTSDGLALLNDAVQFMRDNLLEWLVPLAVLLAPFFLIDARLGFVAMARIDVTNGLDVVIGVVREWIPLDEPLGTLVATTISSVLIVWAMLFRGYLFRALSRSGRRQRIFDARVRGL